MKKWFLLLVLLQLLLLLSIGFSKYLIFQNGVSVYLKVIPVDPRDMFRGDYVTLSYDISSLDSSIISLDEEYYYNKAVYVSLKKDEISWSAFSVSEEIPKDGVFLKAHIPNYYPEQEEITVLYDNLDSFFVEEGSGLQYEKLILEEDLYAEIKIDKKGNGAIYRLVSSDEI